MAKSNFSEFLGIKILTPVGTLYWAALATPSKEYDTYSVAIRFKEDDPLLLEMQTKVDAALTNWHETQKTETKNPLLAKVISPLKPCFDKEGQPTGEWEMRCNKKAYSTTQTPQPAIPAFDSKGKRFSDAIGNGSLGKVSVQLKGYLSSLGGAGISLYPEGVQVLEHKAYVGSQTEFGDMFKEEEGFEAAAAEDGDGFPPPTGATGATGATGGAAGY